jgi:hypothetical protein
MPSNSPASLKEIINLLSKWRQMREIGESVPGISEIAKRSGLSRQTIYAVIKNQRSEFGVVAQIRLARVLQEMSLDPSYAHTRTMRVDLSSGQPRLRLGVHLR